MQPEDFFLVADYLAKIKPLQDTPEILYRSAINRLYYGIYHLVQREYQILIPATEIHRCHAFVKQKIEYLPIKSDYADLEEYRVHADYRLGDPVKISDYADALRLAQRLRTLLLGEGVLEYNEEDDDNFFNRERGQEP